MSPPVCAFSCHLARKHALAALFSKSAPPRRIVLVVVLLPAGLPACLFASASAFVCSAVTGWGGQAGGTGGTASSLGLVFCVGSASPRYSPCLARCVPAPRW
jgi:hypothetical protein